VSPSAARGSFTRCPSNVQRTMKGHDGRLPESRERDRRDLGPSDAYLRAVPEPGNGVVVGHVRQPPAVGVEDGASPTSEEVDAPDHPRHAEEDVQDVVARSRLVLEPPRHHPGDGEEEAEAREQPGPSRRREQRERLVGPGRQAHVSRRGSRRSLRR
jgi:hypothetical protein